MSVHGLEMQPKLKSRQLIKQMDALQRRIDDGHRCPFCDHQSMIGFFGLGYKFNQTDEWSLRNIRPRSRTLDRYPC